MTLLHDINAAEELDLFDEPTYALATDEVHDDPNAERRRGLRVREQRPVKVYEPAAGRYFGGQTEDISATGLRVELPLWTPVRQGAVVTVYVGLNAHGDSLANRRSMVPARVVWINRAPGKHARLEAGVEFLNGIAANSDAA